MTNIFQSQLLLIAQVPTHQLARQIKYLQLENEILRSKLLAQVPLSLQDPNRLLKFAQKLGSALKHLVSIVTPELSPTGSGTRSGEMPDTTQMGVIS